MTATNAGDNTKELYRINDVLSSLAQELGVPVTTKWEDEVLNDLVHSVAKAFENQRNATSLNVLEHIKTKTTATIEAIVRLTPGTWEATRGVNYSDLPNDIKAVGRRINSLHSRKFALMFMNLHGLEALTMEAVSAFDFTYGQESIVRVPDFSEYGETDLIEFYNFLAHVGIISEDLRDEVLSDVLNEG